MTIDIDLRQTVDSSYNIELGALPKLSFDRKVAIVTNPTVAGLHLGYLLSKLHAKEQFIVTVPDGESHKTLSTAEWILDRLFEHRLDRGSLLIAFGGGVVGDMTGFCAALFERGIEFIQIPTTLLSMVDASVGGKTGVNNRFGKNLIGSFNQPKTVYADPHFLYTLPKREFAAGVAEMIKMGVMFDESYFSFLQNANLHDSEQLKKAIETSIRLKASVVAQDEKEHGIRAVLNYGHTFGHVVENETRYSHYLHGEAVAIGMVMANRLAVRLGQMSEEQATLVEDTLQSFNLPTRYKIADPKEFYDKFFLDKKSEGGSLKFILPDGIGSHSIVKDLPSEVVMAALHEFV